MIQGQGLPVGEFSHLTMACLWWIGDGLEPLMGISAQPGKRGQIDAQISC